MKKFVLAAVLGALFGAQANAADLWVEDDVLLGAFNVDVSNTLYNVTFEGGSCIDVFSVCDASAFDFSTSEEAEAAAKALMDQIFISDMSPNDFFDFNPEATAGCGSTNVCIVFTPYALSSDPNSVIRTALFQNNSLSSNVNDFAGFRDISIELIDTSFTNAVYARWTPVAVPEVSATGSLAAIGTLLALMMFLFERRGRRLEDAALAA